MDNKYIIKKQLYVGSTGSGKTYKMLEEVKEKIENKEPFIYLIEKERFDYVYKTKFNYPIKLENLDINIYEDTNKIDWSKNFIFFLIESNQNRIELNKKPKSNMEYILESIKNTGHYMFIDEINYLHTNEIKKLELINNNFKELNLNGYSISIQNISSEILIEIYASLIFRTFNIINISVETIERLNIIKSEDSMINYFRKLLNENHKNHTKYNFLTLNTFNNPISVTIQCNNTEDFINEENKLSTSSDKQNIFNSRFIFNILKK